MAESDLHPWQRAIHGMVRSAYSRARASHLHLAERLAVLWTATIVLDLLFSGFAVLTERGADGSGIHNYGDALFWTTTQLLTISSQLGAPVTTGGRYLDVVMQFVAMTLVTAQAGALGSFLYRRSLERNPMTTSREGA